MVARIIPARAGFTRPPCGGSAPSTDHPRSRGVYVGVHGPPVLLPGSSPLARGLPAAAPRASSQIRIIPARAGFTPPWRPARRWWWDHPRSRGVYRSARFGETVGAGSSPLARGLRGDGAHRARGRGIIPARAGFTRPGRAPGDSHRDHPRSRGVYRLRLGGTGGHDRIIPARAGFTSPRRPRSPRGRDHPRSRGVYSRPYSSSP